MIEIREHTEIDTCLTRIDTMAHHAINLGKPCYVFITDKKPSQKMTQKQRGALHVWCEQFANKLNDAGYTRKYLKINGDIAEVDWTMIAFKEDVYKPMLKALTLKVSTEQQSTVNPSDVANHINRHMGQLLGITIGWPSKEVYPA